MCCDVCGNKSDVYYEDENGDKLCDICGSIRAEEIQEREQGG